MTKMVKKFAVLGLGRSTLVFRFSTILGSRPSGCQGDPKLVLSTQNLKLVLFTQSHASEAKTEICVVENRELRLFTQTSEDRAVHAKLEIRAVHAEPLQ